MKVIDEKGRLFGKLNLIDLAVVVIVVVAVAAVAMKVFGNQAVSAVTSQQVKLTYEVVAEDVPQHVADYCVAHTGGQLMSSGKLLDGSITGCEAVEVSEGDGTRTDHADPDNFAVIQERVDELYAVDDAWIEKAMVLLMTKAKVIAEPSSALPVAAALSGALPVKPEDKAVFVLSGGNADPALLVRLLSGGEL